VLKKWVVTLADHDARPSSFPPTKEPTMTWKIRLALRLLLTAALAVTALANAAFGQTAAAGGDANVNVNVAGAEAPAEKPALTPPQLVTFVEAQLSAELAVQPRPEPVTVDLEITIDATGQVTGVRVPLGIGGGYDDAAAAAARRFVFEPARRSGQAVPARIKYRYVFDAVAPAPPPPPTLGTLDGKVRLREKADGAGDGAGESIGGVAVSVVSEDGQVTRTGATDAGGGFQFADLPPGRYRVKLAGTDLSSLVSTEDVSAGDLTSVTYRLDPAASQAGAGGDATLEFGATATIEAPAREVTKRSLQAEELLRVAGTRGDPLRAIEYMPGVGRSPMANFVIIRGSSPADSEVQLEGAPVSRLYHFGGLTSFVQPRLLEKIDLYPGNFSARYGRKMGGIIDVGVRDPRSDGFHGMADVNLIDSSVLAEGPIARHWSIALAAKRSYIDVFFDKLAPKDQVQVLAAPVYWDYQAIVAYKPSDDDRVRAMVYGSYDNFRVILANPDEADPAIRGNLSTYSGFHRGSLLWQHKYSAAVEHEISLAAGPYAFGQSVGPGLSLDVPGYDGFLRAEWRARLQERFRLIGGLDLADLWTDATYNGPRVTQLDGDPSTFGALTGSQNVQFARSYNFFRPAAYVEAVWQASDRLTVVPGGRVDYIGDIGRWSVDPRLTARFALLPGTTLKAGAGLFSQAPDFSEVLPVVGNPHLRAPHAQHYSAGAEQLIGERVQVTVEAFYKRLSLLTVNSPVPGEILNNDGIGRIYGAEASARLRPTTRSSGFLSYTLSRSERNDHGMAWRLFNWDQTHILTVAGARRVGRGWDLSGTFRYVTGNPLTPVATSIYNANTDTYKPVYGAVNSTRSAAFHRLDLRIERTWPVKHGNIAAYLDVQNAYNRQSEEGRNYNYNFTQSGSIPGLPVIPSIGMRGEI
jgi:TonB family protein